jgi:hypothetical protein
LWHRGTGNEMEVLRFIRVRRLSGSPTLRVKQCPQGHRYAWQIMYPPISTRRKTCDDSQTNPGWRKLADFTVPASEPVLSLVMCYSIPTCAIEWTLRHWFADGDPDSNRTVERHCRVLEDNRPQAPISLTIHWYSAIHCHISGLN